MVDTLVLGTSGEIRGSSSLPWGTKHGVVMQRKIKQSMGPQVDTHKCVENVGNNKFNLVLIAAARAREIRKHHAATDSQDYSHAPVMALLEIQRGEVGVEYLRKIR